MATEQDFNEFDDDDFDTDEKEAPLSLTESNLALAKAVERMSDTLEKLLALGVSMREIEMAAAKKFEEESAPMAKPTKTEPVEGRVVTEDS